MRFAIMPDDIAQSIAVFLPLLSICSLRLTCSSVNRTVLRLLKRMAFSNVDTPDVPGRNSVAEFLRLFGPRTTASMFFAKRHRLQMPVFAKPTSLRDARNDADETWLQPWVIDPSNLKDYLNSKSIELSAEHCINESAHILFYPNCDANEVFLKNWRTGLPNLKIAESVSPHALMNLVRRAPNIVVIQIRPSTECTVASCQTTLKAIGARGIIAKNVRRLTFAPNCIFGTWAYEAFPNLELQISLTRISRLEGHIHETQLNRYPLNVCIDSGFDKLSDKNVDLSDFRVTSITFPDLDESLDLFDARKMMLFLNSITIDSLRMIRFEKYCSDGVFERCVRSQLTGNGWSRNHLLYIFCDSIPDDKHLFPDWCVVTDSSNDLFHI